MSTEESEAYQLKRKVILGNVDVHPTDNALIVNYTVQATIINDDGQPVGGDKKAMQKIVRVKALNLNTNIAGLAQEVVDKCKLIHPNKVKDVEQQLYYLQQRQQSENGDSNLQLERKQRHDLYEVSQDETFEGDVPSMDDIENYIEGLYEEIPDKINSTRSILQLARIVENMEALIENESLLSALGRVLREDGKKSMELVTNIIYIFFCFSNFTHYHQTITANKIGDMCLRVADQEIQRYNIWVKDLDKLENKCILNPENIPYQKELEQEHRKFQAMLKKQDQLIFVSFHLLLNLSEDLAIEVKIVKRDIVKYLIIMMDRSSVELLILAVSFLKKLTIFRENKDELVKNGEDFISKLDKILLMEDQPVLQETTLKLLLNLSFDAGFRSMAFKNGIIQKTVDLLNSKNRACQLLVQQVLYMFSVDEKARPLFSFTDCVPMVLRMILESKGEKVNNELMALAINLALYEKNAQIFSMEGGVKFLMKRAFKGKDPLVFKLLRNISSQSGDIKMPFLDFIDDMMHLLFKSLNTPDILVELLGIIGNLNIPEFDFAKLSEAYKLHDFISKSLTKAAASCFQQDNAKGQLDLTSRGGLAEDDDVTLEVIVLLGTMSADDGMASIIVNSNIITPLLDLMMGKEEDDEIVLQITYCIHNLLIHEVTRNVLISKTQIVSYLIDLLYDRNEQIRRVCDSCLDIIMEIDEDWVKKIKLQKFQWHNQEWLESMAQNSIHRNDQPGYEESTVLYANRKKSENGDYTDSDDEEESDLYKSMVTSF